MLSTTLRRAALRRSSIRIPRSQQSTRVYLQKQQPVVCYFSTDSKEKDSNNSGDSLRDAVHRLKQDNSNNTTTENVSSNNDDLFRKAADLLDTAKSEIALTWQELLNAGKPKSINKKIHPTETPEGNAEYTGPVEIMVIDESEHLTAWERMQRRLTEAPIIADMLSKGEVLYESSGAKQAKQKVDHLSEDAREAWETSQNPWVYRMSSVYDTLTQEHEYTVAVRELRKLDPDFTLEEWKEDVVEHELPIIMKWFLEGKINQLKPWLGEAVFNRIAAEITARKQEGVQIDTHVLAIMNSEILACEVSFPVSY